MRILVIEDEIKIAQAIKKGLAQESYAVDVVNDGKAGLAFAQGDEYDIIILDLMLPGMDGMEICRKLREQKNSVPILMLTARGELDDKVSGLNSGADDYLTKPFAFEELIARVKALTRRPAEMLQPVLKIADLEMDTTSYSVKRANQSVHLSAKEYALLEYMMRNPNRILTKDQIMTHVWDYDADILPNTVEVYIGYLRQKIDKPFKGPNLINTVRGFGYQFGEMS